MTANLHTIADLAKYFRNNIWKRSYVERMDIDVNFENLVNNIR